MKSILENVIIESEYIGNAVWGVDKWRSDKWEVSLYRDDAEIMIEFHLGEGNDGRGPEPADVIYALLSDSYAGSLSFEEFCAEYGYETDSRRAYATWEDCGRNARKLRVLFSEEEIRQLEVEFADY